MIEMKVDGRTIEAKEGETILSALKREGIHVPTLCHLEGLLPSGACRMCVVELEGAPNFVTACSYPVAPGMKILTRSPKVLDARRTIVELLLSNHPDDCLYCARSGKCDLQNLSQALGIRQRLYRGKRNEAERDVAGPIVRDPDKCILCGRCVRVCEEIQAVGAIDFVNRGCKAYIGTAFDQGLNVSSCINCGQCIVNCPTGALTERSYLDEVIAALSDPDKTVVVQHAPAVSVSLAEEFGIEPGQDVDGKMVAALRRLGFKRVFDTSFTADLTIMEEASELAQRIQQGGALPMFTSCSPGWIKFVEQFYPDFIPNLSTCKSPQQMMGAVIKSYFAKRESLDPAKIVSVSIMPCTAKKFECGRPEMAPNHIPDVDYVLTTRELGQLLRTFGVDLMVLPPESADTPFGERSSAGKIFGASGGVMEAAVRTAPPSHRRGIDQAGIQPLWHEGREGDRTKIGDLKSARLSYQDSEMPANSLMRFRRDGRTSSSSKCDLPGGCINGGGQPIGGNVNAARSACKRCTRLTRTNNCVSVTRIRGGADV